MKQNVWTTISEIPDKGYQVLIQKDNPEFIRARFYDGILLCFNVVPIGKKKQEEKTIPTMAA